MDFSRWAAWITWSMVSKEKKRSVGFFSSPAVSAEGFSDRAETLSFTLPIRFRSSSAPSSFSRALSFADSQSPPGEGANLENLVSSSSGSSTFVIISTIESADAGIASIIRGISSASKPNSNAACCIMSWKSDFAFSVP